MVHESEIKKGMTKYQVSAKLFFTLFSWLFVTKLVAKRYFFCNDIWLYVFWIYALIADVTDALTEEIERLNYIAASQMNGQFNSGI